MAASDPFHSPDAPSRLSRDHAIICIGLDGAAIRSVGFLTQTSVLRHPLTEIHLPDPYVAMLHIARDPGAVSRVFIDLQQFFDSEIPFVAAVRAIAPQCRIIALGSESRPSLLAKAIGAGVDGLLADGKIRWLRESPLRSQPLSRTNPIETSAAIELVDPPETLSTADSTRDPTDSSASDFPGAAEPLLTAEELKALLSDHGIQPTAS